MSCVSDPSARKELAERQQENNTFFNTVDEDKEQPTSVSSSSTSSRRDLTSYFNLDNMDSCSRVPEINLVPSCQRYAERQRGASGRMSLVFPTEGEKLVSGLFSMESEQWHYQPA